MSESIRPASRVNLLIDLLNLRLKHLDELIIDHLSATHAEASWYFSGQYFYVAFIEQAGELQSEVSEMADLVSRSFIVHDQKETDKEILDGVVERVIAVLNAYRNKRLASLAPTA